MSFIALVPLRYAGPYKEKLNFLMTSCPYALPFFEKNECVSGFFGDPLYKTLFL